MLTLTGGGPQNPGGGGPAPSAPTLVSAAVIGWSGSGDGHIDDIAEVVTAGVWTGADSVVGQWYYNGTEVTLAAVIEAQANGSFTYKETATNAVGDTLSPASNVLSALTTAPAHCDVAPTISVVGIEAVLDLVGTWTGNPRPSGYTYQWQLDVGSGFVDIPGEVAISTGFITGGSNSIRCIVTGYNTIGGSTYQSSADSNSLT